MDKENRRAGDTVITSVSISKQFKDLMDEYNLSPTEAIRRGIAVRLCDLGVKKYKTDKNIERLKQVKEFLKNIETDEKLKKRLNNIMKRGEEYLKELEDDS